MLRIMQRFSTSVIKKVSAVTPIPSKQPSDAAIQSVQRAAAILRCFTKTDSELSVTALSQELRLHKSTISRLLTTLKQEGFVEQNPETGKYRLGLALVTLAGIALERIDVQRIAQPYLTDLAELVQETVNVVVLTDRDSMNIASAPSPRPIRYVGRMGRRTPPHCTAGGKLLLAYLAPKKRQEILPKELARFTDKTIVDLQTLNQALLQIREQGYAVAQEEHQEGVSTVAAPICDHAGQVCAALSVSGPTYRIGPKEIETILEPLRQTAREISTQLGYTSGSG
jgi:DNA-binding IclR family transcriptional regulator